MAEELCVSLVPLFNQLSIDSQRQIEQLVDKRHVQRGTVVVSPDNSDQLVIIEQGTARVYQLNSSGDEQVQRVLAVGEYVGETWLLGVKNVNSYVEMTTTGNICLLRRSDFAQLLRQQPQLTFKLLAGQAALIDELRQQTRLMGLPSIEERLTAYFQLLEKSQGRRTINLPLKLKDLSSYLGTTPETLSRTLNKLEQQGLISRHRRQVRLLK